eukprot:3188526-Prymnesium_polylepis.1
MNLLRAIPLDSATSHALHTRSSRATLLFGSTQVCCEREYGKGGVCGLACGGREAPRAHA